MDLPLSISILALFVGPVIYNSVRAQRAVAALDAFALVAVAGIVFVHILPQSIELAGWMVLPVAALGMFGPGLLCGTRLFHGRESRVVALPLALLAIGLHALLDGIALASGREELAMAVVIHRVPDGLGIWWIVRPLYGQAAALGLVAGVAVFTVLGFFFGESLLAAAPGEALALAQALLAGSLLHVILRHPPTATGEEPEQRWHFASAIGGLLAAALVVGMGYLHGHREAPGHAHDGTSGFLELALQSAPALLLAYLFVGGAHALFLDLFRVLRRGSPFSLALRGTLVGLPVPVCSCGVIPLYRSLIVGGVPASAAMAFLVATPELELAAVVLTWTLLGPKITFARILAAFALALFVGRLVGARVPALPAPAAHARAARPPLAKRLAEGLRYGFGDMVDSTAPWILVGIALAAVAEPFLDPRSFAALPALLEIPLFALVGMPLYVCASGSTPLVAVLLAKGVSPGAAIAFLLTGPATNLTTFGMLARLHGRRIAVLFSLTTACAAVLLGYAAHFALRGNAVELSGVHEHGASLWHWTALALLAALYLTSLLRQGVRGFVGQVIAPHGHGALGDACGHEHEHEHGHAQAHGH
jgi:hypothetical protein